MCASRKSIMTRPETAIAAFSNTVERTVTAVRRVEVLAVTCPRPRPPGDGELAGGSSYVASPITGCGVDEPGYRARPTPHAGPADT